MGRIYGRTHYWVCFDNQFLRVVLELGGYINNGKRIYLFKFLNQKDNVVYFSESSLSFAKTKKEAVEKQNTMKNFDIKKYSEL